MSGTSRNEDEWPEEGGLWSRLSNNYLDEQAVREVFEESSSDDDFFDDDLSSLYSKDGNYSPGNIAGDCSSVNTPNANNNSGKSLAEKKRRSVQRKSVQCYAVAISVLAGILVLVGRKKNIKHLLKY